FNHLLPSGQASPPAGAVAGRYDIAEFYYTLNYDPDGFRLFAFNQIPPTGENITFYCQPAPDKPRGPEKATPAARGGPAMLLQIHRIYLRELPFITLYSPITFALVRKGTHNYLPGPYTDTYNIEEWWCDQGKC